uniref:UPF0193 protein EVG1-like n=1 Tax=Phallusia mammillata TaxID=59560 RepID=A0A6F9D7G6_9ASCI|nr:UPF0193 protein EVG1-like [Phallusia mammillata]
MKSRQAVAQGGMFGTSNPPPLSNQTKDLLKVMMEESKLSNFQRRKLTETVGRGRSLPLKMPPTCSEKVLELESFPPPQKSFTMRGVPSPSIRSRSDIEESGAYQRDQFVPKPIKSLEKEKDRLSNIMAFGEDVKPKSKEEKLKELRLKTTQVKKIDRFDEIQAEIEERHRFLEEMEKLGQGKKYRPIISSQISILIREMEIIDKERTAKLQQALEVVDKS